MKGLPPHRPELESLRELFPFPYWPSEDGEEDTPTILDSEVTQRARKELPMRLMCVTYRFQWRDDGTIEAN